MTNEIKKGLLALPELAAPTENKKRFVHDPDITMLKDEQLDAFNALKNFVAQKGGGMYLLEGYAGTGKTFLVSKFVEWYLNSVGKIVGVTAPTNKAVKVQKRFAEYSDGKLLYGTIHSMLGLVQRINSYGKQYFARNNKKDSYPIEELNLAIVDEASMLNDELFMYLTEHVEAGLKVIFVGDPCQIPPVNKTDSIPFNPKEQKNHGIGVSTLTEIVRQAEDNPIIKVTLKVRKALGRDITLPTRKTEFTDDLNGVFFLGPDEKKFFYQLLKNYFTSDNFKQDADFCKVVAWTNKTVDTFNSIIRLMIYGDAVDKLLVGEKLIANKPIFNDTKDIIFSNNDEFEVKSIKIESKKYKMHEIKFYVAVVERIELDDVKRKPIKIVHEDSEEAYLDILENLKDIAKSEKKGSYQAAGKWRDFFEFQENFADVNYNYAITAHKSQGSTYTNGFVLETDINYNKRIKERNRIKYTAFTRPSNRLFIIK